MTAIDRLPLTITSARLDEIPSAAAILAEAFALDPVMAAIVPLHRRRHGQLKDLFAAQLTAGSFSTGTVDIARRGSEGPIVGVAAWEGPDSRRGATRRLLRQVPQLLRILGPCGLIQAAKIPAVLQRSRPQAPHWYLAAIGVASDAQGQGIGRQLLTTHLSALDTMRQSAYLESSTPTNRRLYGRHGFEDLGVIRGLPGARPAGMLRRPVSTPG